ncbi:G protein alpha subunit [Penicillium chrysogenum]|nr:G protein alpha subunit [Penicillium chrysogenum]
MGEITWNIVDIDVGCLIFIAALSGYDQCLAEDHKTTISALFRALGVEKSKFVSFFSPVVH